MSTVHVRDLAVGYDGRPILEGLSFEVHRGEIFVILGRSGCGKSTVLKHLIGLEVPLAGSIEIEGIGAPHLAGGRPAFGVSFQYGALFSSLTLAQNVEVPLRRWTDLPDEALRPIAESRLRLVGLAGFENHLPSEISGGMRKRAAIARALALDPPLLFLDEPSAGLDPVTAVELDELIRGMRDDLGVTAVLVTHDLESILRIGDRCILLDAEAHGIVAEGDPRALRDTSDDPRVRRFFHRLPESA